MSIPHDHCERGDDISADNILFSADSKFEAFWFVVRSIEQGARDVLGRDWADYVQIIAFSIVWDPSYTPQCEKARAGYETDDWDWEHSEECEELFCCVEGYDRYQWLDDNIGYDHEWLGHMTLEQQRNQAVSIISDLISDEDNEPVWFFAGSLTEWSETLFGQSVFSAA